MSSSVAVAELTDPCSSVAKTLDRIGLGAKLANQQKVILKPNLVVNEPPPVTTDVRIVEGVVAYCLAHIPAGAQIIVAEGSGGCSTMECFEALGYRDLMTRYPLRLVDLDQENVEFRKDKGATLYKNFPLAESLRGGFLISIPTLKEHNITTTSLSLKNMIGIAPSAYFSGYWKFRKSEVHRYNIHQPICDINLHRKVDLAIIDASVGLRCSHLEGPPCDPPKRRILAGFDPVAVDVVGCAMLGCDWKKTRHIWLANGKLGCGDAVNILDD